MLNYKIGEKFQIQCYKHNGKVHRMWDEAVLLDIQKEYMVFGNRNTLVIEAGGDFWRTSEPAIMYFFKKSWYNVIVQFKKKGIYYYCNVASPFIIEEGTIKYIDYDLDLRIFSDGSYKILDTYEYKKHKKLMNYSEELDYSINIGLKEIINRYKNKDLVFNNKRNVEYLKKYKKVRKGRN